MKFEDYAPEGNKFVKQIAAELGTPEDTDHAYRVMKSVFQTLREILSPEESLHLISQLPMPIKALYVDGWKLKPTTRIRSMKEFVDALRAKSDRSAGRDFGDDDMAKHHAKCVLNVVKKHVATGEVQHMIDQFPMELAELWLSDAGVKAE